MLHNCPFIPNKVSCTFYKVLYMDRKHFFVITNISVSGEKILPFILGYKEFITGHKIFTLPIILTFIKI